MEFEMTFKEIESRGLNWLVCSVGRDGYFANVSDNECVKSDGAAGNRYTAISSTPSGALSAALVLIRTGTPDARLPDGRFAAPDVA